jgi:hypothetical protein
MTNPDDATTPTGLAAGIYNDPLGMSSGFGSSTHGGATDGARGDLDNGLGSVTPELVMKATAGPDVNPDQQTIDGGTDIYHSGTGVGAVDGVRPDLADATGLTPVEPPTDTGINPYAMSSETAGATTSADQAFTGLSHADVHSIDGAAQLGDVTMAHTDLDVSLAPAVGDVAEEHGDVAFGGPLDDGLG